MSDTCGWRAWVMVVCGLIAWAPALAADQGGPGADPDARERAAMELYNTFREMPHQPEPIARTKGWVPVFQAVIERYPETFAACTAKLRLAGAIVLLHEEAHQEHTVVWTSPEGRGVLEKAISLAEEVMASPRLQDGAPGPPLGKTTTAGLRASAASSAAQWCERLGDTERELAFRLQAVKDGRPDAYFVQMSVRRLGRIYHDMGQAEESRRWWERALNDYPELPSWEWLVFALWQSYKQMEPRRLELAAALCTRALGRPEAIHRDSIREIVQDTVPWAEKKIMVADPAERVAQYLRLWQSGYDHYMVNYLTEAARKEMTAESFAAWLQELREKGVGLTTFEVLEATQSEDAMTARVSATLRFQRDLPPDFVSGQVTFELASEQWPYPGKQRMWLIQKGVPVP